jgi:hypothetical protein
VVVATAFIVAQQRRLAQAQAELERLRAEVAPLPALQAELSRWRQVEVDQAELKRLREQNNAEQLELLRLRAKATNTRQAEAEAAQLRTELERQTADGSGLTNGIAGPMGELMQAGLEQMTQRRLDRMQERLNLSPAQAQAIRDILTHQTRGIAEATKGVIAGKIDQQKLAALRQGKGDPESQIQALLSPEQQTAYATLREEEKLNTARSAANMEPLQMQTTLDLTAEQQDKVFAVLYDQAVQQQKTEASDPQPANPAEAMQGVMNRKLQSLEGVLTPTQLAGYRQQQELQLTFLKRIVSQTEPQLPSP